MEDHHPTTQPNLPSFIQHQQVSSSSHPSIHPFIHSSILSLSPSPTICPLSLSTFYIRLLPWNISSCPGLLYSRRYLSPSQSLCVRAYPLPLHSLHPMSTPPPPTHTPTLSIQPVIVHTCNEDDFHFAHHQHSRRRYVGRPERESAILRCSCVPFSASLRYTPAPLLPTPPPTTTFHPNHVLSSVCLPAHTYMCSHRDHQVSPRQGRGTAR